MRLLDEDIDRACSRVTIYLTHQEAVELRDSLEALVAGPSGGHEHVSDADYKKEITVCLYDSVELSEFSDRSRRLIELDK